MTFLVIYIIVGLFGAFVAIGATHPFERETFPFILFGGAAVLALYALAWPLVIAYNAGDFIRIKYRRGGR